MAGYRFAGGDLDKLTQNQELLVALVAEEMIEYQVKLAGGEMKGVRSKARRGKKGKDSDPYGDRLALNKRIKNAAKEFTPEELAECYKPL
jgi:hypothetical protein